MKRIILVVLPMALLLMLALPGAALAVGNTTDVEQKWVDFQKAVTNQMVKDGKMTRQDADKWVNDLQTKFAASTGDSIYQIFAQRMQPGDKGKQGIGKDGKAREHGDRQGAAFRVYSMLTGKTVDDLKKTCTDNKLTIWQLAKNEGKLDTLKAKLYDGQAAGLDALVKSGVMSDQQRLKIMEHVKSELDSK